MRWWSRPSRPVLAVLAVAFSASLLAYTGLWFVVASPEPKVELSFDNTYLPSEHAQLIDAVHKNSPAEKAGLRPADRIVAIDGQPIADESFMRNIWLRHQPGDQIRLTIVRPSASSPVFLTATFRQSPSESPGGLLGRQLSNWFPAPFVLVGLAVLFLRLEDPNAWLLVLVFGGLIVTRDLPPTSPHPAWWPFAMAYQALLLGMLGPLFYWFFAVFPARSPIDRRLPWLKWSSLAIAFALTLGGIRVGALRLPPPLQQSVGDRVSGRIAFLIVFAYLMLGLVSFATNFFTTPDQVAHGLESLLDPFRGATAGMVPEGIVQTALESCDAVRTLLGRLTHNSAGGPVSPVLLGRLGVRTTLAAPTVQAPDEKVVDGRERVEPSVRMISKGTSLRTRVTSCQRMATVLSESVLAVSTSRLRLRISQVMSLPLTSVTVSVLGRARASGTKSIAHHRRRRLASRRMT